MRIGKKLALLPGSGIVLTPAAAPPAPIAVFDRDGLLDRLMNNVELAKRVAGVFIRDVPSQLAALSAALQDADADRIRLTAHSLKGAAATIGGATVRETAFEIEKLGVSGDLAAAGVLLPQLICQTEMLRAEVELFRVGESDDR